MVVLYSVQPQQQYSKTLLWEWLGGGWWLMPWEGTSVPDEGHYFILIPWQLLPGEGEREDKRRATDRARNKSLQWSLSVILQSVLSILIFSDLKNWALLATWSLLKLTLALWNAALSWFIYSYSKLFNWFCFYLPQEHNDVLLDCFSSLSPYTILSIIHSIN